MNSTNSKKISTKNLILIKIGVFLLALSALCYFAILPTMNKISETKDDINLSRLKIRQNEESKKNIGKLSEDLEKIRPQLDKLNKVFVSKNKELEFITTLEGIADKNMIEQELKLSDFPDNENNHSEVPINITLKGGFENLTAYLKDLESSSYYISIYDISIGSKKGSMNGPNDQIDMLIKANTYFN